jgi:hypothetical protein
MSEPITLTYDVYGSSVAGTVIAQPGETFFETPRVPSGSNTLRLFRNGSQVAVKASGFAQCATPTPTATATPTETPTSEPTIAVPTATPTATPLPVECSVSGTLYQGPDPMSDSFLRRVRAVGARVQVIILRGPAKTINIPITSTTYSTTIECGQPYRVQVNFPRGGFVVRSKPVTHSFWVTNASPTATGRYFGLWATSVTSSSSSSSSASKPKSSKSNRSKS